MLDVHLGTTRRQIPISIAHAPARFFPDSKRIIFLKLLISIPRPSHTIYNTETGEIEGRIFGDFESVQISLNGNELATVEGSVDPDKVLACRWGGLENGTIKLLQKHELFADRVNFSPDLKSFVTNRKVTQDLTREITHREFSTGKILSTFQYDGYNDSSTDVLFAADGTVTLDQHKRAGGHFQYVSRPGEALKVFEPMNDISQERPERQYFTDSTKAIPPSHIECYRRR